MYNGKNSGPVNGAFPSTCHTTNQMHMGWGGGAAAPPNLGNLDNLGRANFSRSLDLCVLCFFPREIFSI